MGRTPAVQFTFELTVIKLRPNSRSTLQKSSGWIQKIPVIVRKFIISVMLDSVGAATLLCRETGGHSASACRRTLACHVSRVTRSRVTSCDHCQCSHHPEHCATHPRL